MINVTVLDIVEQCIDFESVMFKYCDNQDIIRNSETLSTSLP
jgi:hypothetical protein